MPELNLLDLLIAGAGAFVLGVSKSGVKGIFILTVTCMAIVFGAKASTGLIIPLLIFADIIAVIYYNRHAQWGKDVPEELFKKIMALIIIGSVVMMIFWERKPDLKLTDNIVFTSIMGSLAGVTTMIGNLAGPFSNIFFLSSRIPKNEFIGTAAWLFFIINIFKLPFHIFHWESISMESMAVNLRLFPMVIVGFLVGLKIVEKIKNQAYRKLILVLTAIGAILIFFK